MQVAIFPPLSGNVEARDNRVHWSGGRLHAKERLSRRRAVGKLLRVVLVGGTFVVSAVGNHALGLDAPMAAFAALQTFTLGLDVAPAADRMANGGWATAAVVGTRFVAPLIAAESVLFGALMLGAIRRPNLFLDDHVVIVGSGEIAHAVAETLLHQAHEAREHLEVVLVEPDEDANVEGLVEQGAWVVPTLHEARAGRARAVLILASDDVANVAAMLDVLGHCEPRGAPWLHVQIHDERLRRSASGLVPEARQGEVHLFDVYDDAGCGVASRCLGRGVIVGFGSMGRGVLRHLGPGTEVFIVDRDVGRVPARPLTRSLAGELGDAHVAQAIEAFVREGGASTTTVFLCTTNDIRNLDLALRLEADFQAIGAPVRLVTRMLKPPLGSPELIARLGVNSVTAVVAARFANLALRGARYRSSGGVWPAVVRFLRRVSAFIGTA